MIRYLFYIVFFIVFNTYAKSQGLESMEAESSNIELMINQNDIKSKIIEIAQIIDQDYKYEEIVIIMIMKGAFILTSDLVREIKSPFSIEAITCSSYGQNGSKRGSLKIKGIEDLDLKSKNVLIVDDIFDSGNTLSNVVKEVLKQNPKSVKSLVLLMKKTPNRIKDVILPSYYLFEIEDKFVIGYGLDYKEYFRGLKGIYFIQ